VVAIEGFCGEGVSWAALGLEGEVWLNETFLIGSAIVAASSYWQPGIRCITLRISGGVDVPASSIAITAFYILAVEPSLRGETTFCVQTLSMRRTRDLAHAFAGQGG
jgi:hypothetical protein